MGSADTGRPVRHLLVAVAVGAIAAAVTAPIVLSRQPVYEAGATVEVDQPSLLVTGGSEVVLKLTRLRLKYAPLVATDTILAPVASTLDVPVDRLRGKVSASAPGESLLITVDARTDRAADAVRFANAAADELGTYADREQADLEVRPVDRYRLTTIEPARGALRDSPTKRQAASSGAAAGLAVAVLVFAGQEALSHRRRELPAASP